jgi:nicotinamidase-related amidase
MKEPILRRKFLRGTLTGGASAALGVKCGPPEGKQAAGGVLRMPVRYYQIAQMYGPGMPPSGSEGLHDEILEKPVGQVGLVLGHVWNIGEPHGPYPIDKDANRPGEAANWVPVAHKIIKTRIRPALEAARKAGIAVFHLAQHSYAKKYPQYRAIAADPDFNPAGAVSYEQCVRPRSNDEIWRHEYGENYPGPVWQTHPDKFDIASDVKPLAEEAVFLTGYQLNGLCRRKDIDTLFYAGFMADICLLDVSGALREMANKFRYRCVALRDCTTAYEYAKTHEQRWMTFAAIRRVEQDMGFSALSNDFIQACESKLSRKRKYKENNQ